MYDMPTEADLDASVELLAFMWRAIGNDAASVTPEALNLVHLALAQNFTQLPPELQMLFVNGRTNNSAIQAAWSAAEPSAQMVMAQQFQQVLTVLGLMPGGATGQALETDTGGQSLNADIASNIAWNSSGAGDWNSR